MHFCCPFGQMENLANTDMPIGILEVPCGTPKTVGDLVSHPVVHGGVAVCDEPVSCVEFDDESRSETSSECAAIEAHFRALYERWGLEYPEQSEFDREVSLVVLGAELVAEWSGDHPRSDSDLLFTECENSDVESDFEESEYKLPRGTWKNVKRRLRAKDKRVAQTEAMLRRGQSWECAWMQVLTLYICSAFILWVDAVYACCTSDCVLDNEAAEVHIEVHQAVAVRPTEVPMTSAAGGLWNPLNWWGLFVTAWLIYTYFAVVAAFIDVTYMTSYWFLTTVWRYIQMFRRQGVRVSVWLWRANVRAYYDEIAGRWRRGMQAVRFVRWHLLRGELLPIITLFRMWCARIIQRVEPWVEMMYLRAAATGDEAFDQVRGVAQSMFFRAAFYSWLGLTPGAMTLLMILTLPNPEEVEIPYEVEAIEADRLGSDPERDLKRPRMDIVRYGWTLPSMTRLPSDFIAGGHWTEVEFSILGTGTHYTFRLEETTDGLSGPRFWSARSMPPDEVICIKTFVTGDGETYAVVIMKPSARTRENNPWDSAVTLGPVAESFEQLVREAGADKIAFGGALITLAVGLATATTRKEVILPVASFILAAVAYGGDKEMMKLKGVIERAEVAINDFRNPYEGGADEVDDVDTLGWRDAPTVTKRVAASVAALRGHAATVAVSAALGKTVGHFLWPSLDVAAKMTNFFTVYDAMGSVLGAVKAVAAVAQYMAFGNPEALAPLADPIVILSVRATELMAASLSDSQSEYANAMELLQKMEVALVELRGPRVPAFMELTLRLRHHLVAIASKVDHVAPAGVIILGPNNTGKSMVCEIILKLIVAAMRGVDPKSVKVARGGGPNKHDDDIKYDTPSVLLDDPDCLADPKSSAEQLMNIMRYCQGGPVKINAAALEAKQDFFVPIAVGVTSNAEVNHIASDKAFIDPMAIQRRLQVAIRVEHTKASLAGPNGKMDRKALKWSIGTFSDELATRGTTGSREDVWAPYKKVASNLTTEEVIAMAVRLSVDDLRKSQGLTSDALKVLANPPGLLCPTCFDVVGIESKRCKCTPPVGAQTLGEETAYMHITFGPPLWLVGLCITLYMVRALFALAMSWRGLAELYGMWTVAKLYHASIDRRIADYVPEDARVPRVRTFFTKIYLWAGVAYGEIRDSTETRVRALQTVPGAIYRSYAIVVLRKFLLSPEGKALVALTLMGAGVYVVRELTKTDKREAKDESETPQPKPAVQAQTLGPVRSVLWTHLHPNGLTRIRICGAPGVPEGSTVHAFVVSPGVIAMPLHVLCGAKPWSPGVVLSIKQGSRWVELEGVNQVTSAIFEESDFVIIIDHRVALPPLESGVWPDVVEEIDVVGPAEVHYYDSNGFLSTTGFHVPSGYMKITHKWKDVPKTDNLLWYPTMPTVAGMCHALATDVRGRVVGYVVAGVLKDGVGIGIRPFSQADFRMLADVAAEKHLIVPYPSAKESDLVAITGLSAMTQTGVTFDTLGPQHPSVRWPHIGATVPIGAIVPDKTTPRGSGRVVHPMADEIALAFGLEPGSLMASGGYDGRYVDETGVERKASVLERAQQRLEKKAALPTPAAGLVPWDRIVIFFTEVIRTANPKRITPPLDWVDMLRGREGTAVGPTDLSTSAGLPAPSGPKRGWCVRDPQGMNLPGPALVRNAQVAYTAMTDGLHAPVMVARELEKTGEGLDKKKVLTANTRTMFATNVPSMFASKLLMADICNAILKTAAMGIRSGINMVGPEAEALYNELAAANEDGLAIAGDEEAMDKSWLSHIFCAMTLLIFNVALILGYDRRGALVRARWLVAGIHPLVIIRDEVHWSYKQLVSGLVFTTVINSVGTAIKTLAVFILVLGLDLGTAAYAVAGKAYYGDDQVLAVKRSVAARLTGPLWQEMSLKLGYVTTSDLDKSQAPSYQPLLGGVSFLKRTFAKLQLTQGEVIVARLPLKSIAKSLMLPKGKTTPDPQIYAQCAENAYKELWLWGPEVYDSYARRLEKWCAVAGALFTVPDYWSLERDYYAGRLQTWAEASV